MADSEIAKPGDLGAKLNMVQKILSEKLSTDTKELNKEDIDFIAQCVIEVEIEGEGEMPVEYFQLGVLGEGRDKGKFLKDILKEATQLRKKAQEQTVAEAVKAAASQPASPETSRKTPGGSSAPIPPKEEDNEGRRARSRVSISGRDNHTPRQPPPDAWAGYHSTGKAPEPTFDGGLEADGDVLVGSRVESETFVGLCARVDSLETAVQGIFALLAREEQHSNIAVVMQKPLKTSMRAFHEAIRKLQRAIKATKTLDDMCGQVSAAGPMGYITARMSIECDVVYKQKIAKHSTEDIQFQRGNGSVKRESDAFARLVVKVVAMTTGLDKTVIYNQFPQYPGIWNWCLMMRGEVCLNCSLSGNGTNLDVKIRGDMFGNGVAQKIVEEAQKMCAARVLMLEPDISVVTEPLKAMGRKPK